MSAPASAPLDMDKLNAFIGQFVGDLGAAVHAGMVVIGEKLGLYKALAAGPMLPAELAKKTNTDERYIREWLSSQAAGGYVSYDAATKTFSLSTEQAFALANEDSPAYIPGAFELALGSLAAVPRITESFRTGAGMGWGEHHEGVFHGCEKFFPSRLRRESDDQLDSVFERCAGETGSGRARRGRRLRQRRFDPADGPSISQIAVHRF